MLVTEINGVKEKCTGCFACANACPKKAINLPLDSEGFYFPVIDKNQCVNCGRCEAVCQINHKKEKESMGKMYSFMAEDAVRMKSSSGGAFYHLAQCVLVNDGVVYGAAYDSMQKKVVHTSTSYVSLEDLMRSKYVQSDVGDSYRQAEADLKSEKQVMFVGTPCQIHGLKNYLNKDYNNLVTVDFVCHGVPSPGFLSDVIGYYERKEQASVTNVTFREKDPGWRDQVTKLYFDTGKVIKEKSSYYYYYYLFLHNCTLRKSCYTCMNPENHIADITVMDYWQIKGDDNKGVSVIKLNTQKGAALFDFMEGNFQINVIDNPASLSSAFIRHCQIKGYTRAIKDREYFFDYYKKNGFEKTLNSWYPCYYRKSIFMGKIYTTGGKFKSKLKRMLGR